MPFDQNLAARLRTHLGRKKNIEEKTLFGCFCFLNGNVLVGVWKNSLIFRLGDEGGEDALDITGMAMKGWVVVGADSSFLYQGIGLDLDQNLGLPSGTTTKHGESWPHASSTLPPAIVVKTAKFRVFSRLYLRNCHFVRIGSGQ